MEQIITSILDSDLYKFTQQAAVIKKFPDVDVIYEFINRDKSVQFPEGFDVELRKQVQGFSDLRFTEAEELLFAKKCPYLDRTYFTYLRGFKFNPSHVGIVQNGGELIIKICGPWHETILWEVPLMATISELYFRMKSLKPTSRDDRRKNNTKKANFFNHNGHLLVDFGTRRRFSEEIHEEVICDLLDNNLHKKFVGTSNVKFAIKYNTRVIGTHAHEWFMVHAAKYGYKMANRLALDNWVSVYRGDLGIALSDTFTTDAFFYSFDKIHSKLFDGVRHDSGDPIAFGNKVIEHYGQLGIDPTTKTIVFSDNLNIESAEIIAKAFNGRIRISFGIGTNLTNDVGVKPLNMVIKITGARVFGKRYVPTIKLSDNPEKHIGPQEDIEICKRQLNQYFV